MNPDDEFRTQAAVYSLFMNGGERLCFLCVS